MSVKDNASKNYGSQRPFLPNHRGAPVQGMPAGQVNFSVRPVAYATQQGSFPPSQNFTPVPYNMGMMAPPGNPPVYLIRPGSVGFGGVIQNQPLIKMDQYSHQPYPYGSQPHSMAPTAQTLNYPTVSQPVSQQVAMPQLGMQPQMPVQMHSQQAIPSPATSVPQAVRPQRAERQRIRITDPTQGGKDVTEEILKKKEPVAQVEPQVPVVTAPQVPVSVPENGTEKIKAEFAAKVAAAKAGILEQSRAAARAATEQPVLPEAVSSRVAETSDASGKLQSDKIEPVAVAAGSEQSEKLSEPVSKSSDEESKSEPVSDDVSANDAKPSKKDDNEVVVNGTDAVEQEVHSETESSTNLTNELEIKEPAMPEKENDITSIKEQAEKLESPKESLPDDNVAPRTPEASNLEPVPKEPEQADDVKADVEVAVEVAVEAAVEESTPNVDVKLDKSDNDEEKNEVDGQLANGVDKSTSGTGAALVQVPKKKKKNKYKEKDTDLMSAFTDKPEEEVVETPPETENEVEDSKEEPAVEEETWENKDIKADEEVSKAEKGLFYDRDFLLRFQDSKEKPKDLPNMDIILQEAHEPTKLEKERLQSAGNDLFMPKFIRQGSGGRQAGMNRSGKGGRIIAPKKIIPTNFDTKVELKKTENAWVRSSEKTKEVPGEETETEALYRQATGILNKLTPQKFDKLLDQMKALQINNVEKLKGVIDLIFEKALSEPNFSKAYAKLCDEVSKQKIHVEKEQSGKGQNVTFKRILLNKCQVEFEKEKSDELELEKEQNRHYENADEEKAWQEELALRRQKTKRRSLGNIRFIGELFKLKMLTEAIMHTCIMKLLKDRDEESLECLCKLVTTIGKDIDHEKAKPRTNQYFEQVDKIINSKKVSSRIVFMLQDLKDLRRSNWVARRALDLPKTIDEIHEEAKQEEIQMQMAHQQAAQKRLMNKGGRDSPAPNRSMPNDEGWNQVQSKGGRNMQPVDPSRLKITKRADSDNISLGPFGRPGAWAQGASGGGSSRFAVQSDGESRQGNRFSALSGGESGGSRLDSRGRSGQRGQQSKFGRPSGPANPRRGGTQHQQHTDEKAEALANVRRMLSVEGNRAPSPSSMQAKADDPERSTSGTRTPDVSPLETQEPSDVPPVTEISEQKIKNETKLTVDEYLATHDLKEAEACIRELNCASKHNVLVSEAINIAIEKKLDQCKQIGSLLLGFIASGLLSLESFKEGLNDVLEYAEDIAVDIPHLWTNLGVLLGPSVESEKLPLSVLKTLVEPLIECNKAGLLMAETLAAASKVSNESDVALLWQKSGLTWESLLREGTDTEEFLAKQKMQFTTQEVQQQQLQQKDISSILAKTSCTCEAAIDWIEKNVPRELQSESTFIRDLCTAVYKRGVTKESEFNAAPIKEFKNLLMKYIDNDRKKELQALYAAQLLAEELNHPKDFVRLLFEALYDEEIISEDSVTLWEKSEEEPVGKGNALSSVQSFLTWLKTSEEETYEDSK